MNSKLILVTVLSLSVAVALPVLAEPKWGPERLDAPEWVLITERDGYVYFDWTTVYVDEAQTVPAAKYSLDIEGMVTYFDEIEQVRKEAYVEVSFGTSDRTDGRDMSESDLAIPKSDLRAAILSALGLTEDEVGPMLLEGAAKVKALNPGKGNGPQNNPFSETEELEVLL